MVSLVASRDRLAQLACFLTVAGLAHAQASQLGSWSGPFDWKYELNPSGCNPQAYDELSHAAFEELRRIYRPSPAAVVDKAARDASLFRILAVGDREPDQ